jgi:hypothetical protein
MRLVMVAIGLHGLWRVHGMIARPHAAGVPRAFAPFMAILPSRPC